MSIPLSQLETWGLYQSLDILTSTYENVKNVLSGFDPSSDIEYEEPYLQGSYANHTHIYSKGDIDIVVELASTFSSNLTPESKRLAGLVPATYNRSNFFADLYDYLSNYYGSENIERGSKTIKIKPAPGRKSVDVVVCCTHKEYSDPTNPNSAASVGIRLVNGVINYPKIHKLNGRKKMEDTYSKYKTYVRIFKNLNKKLQNDRVDYEAVPSYFIECLLFNVPNSCFSVELDIGFGNILQFLNSLTEEKATGFITQSEQQLLFGDGCDSTQWEVKKFLKFMAYVNSLHNN